MKAHDSEGPSHSALTENLSGLLALSLLGWVLFFPSILVVNAVWPSSGAAQWLHDPSRLAAMFVWGAVTMLMAPIWLPPPSGVPVAAMRVVVVATLSPLPFLVFPELMSSEYDREWARRVGIACLSWIAGGLPVSLLRRTWTYRGSTPDSVPLVAMVLGALGGILAVPFGVALLRAPLEPRRQYGKGLLIGAGVVYSVLALLYLLFRTLP